MKTLLITGPIGSGKSLASRVLAGCGVPVYDCDAQAKELYCRHPELIGRLEKALGQSLRVVEGQVSEGLASEGGAPALDKKKLAAILFVDPAARRARLAA